VVLGDPPPALTSLIAERKRLGLDTHDELWRAPSGDTEYHMAPAASFQHGKIQIALGVLLTKATTGTDYCVGAEFNLGTQENFRVPDLGVHRGLPNGIWLSTAAILVEVKSPNDETYDKFDFYFARNVEEILIADLASSTVSWFVRSNTGFVRAESSAILGLSINDVASALEW
jgi:Uma2 family endonuclease